MKKYILILLILGLFVFKHKGKGLLLDVFMQPKGHIVTALGLVMSFTITYYVGDRPTSKTQI